MSQISQARGHAGFVLLRPQYNVKRVTVIFEAYWFSYGVVCLLKCGFYCHLCIYFQTCSTVDQNMWKIQAIKHIPIQSKRNAEFQSKDYLRRVTRPLSLLLCLLIHLNRNLYKHAVNRKYAVFKVSTLSLQNTEFKQV